MTSDTHERTAANRPRRRKNFAEYDAADASRGLDRDFGEAGATAEAAGRPRRFAESGSAFYDSLAEHRRRLSYPAPPFAALIVHSDSGMKSCHGP